MNEKVVNLKKAVAGAIAMVVMVVTMVLPSAAFAANVNGNTAYNDNAPDLVNQTIVGENDGNSVTVTNTLDDNAVSPTGIQLGNIFGIVAVVLIIGGSLVVVNRKRAQSRAARED